MACDSAKVLLGTQKAIARAGEPSVTVTRTTVTQDPANPTRTTTVTATYTMPGFIYPDTRYLPGSTATVTRTMFIPDLLGVQDSELNYLNTVDSVAWVTQEGDVITVAGRSYKLLQNEQPRMGGVQVACLHEATAL